MVALVASHNGGFFRKNSQYLESYLNLAVEMMQDMDDDDNWENGVFGEEDELMENDNVPHVLGCTVCYYYYWWWWWWWW